MRCRSTSTTSEFSIDDLKAEMLGVECLKDKGVVDEIPDAYKNTKEVMRAQNDLVEVVTRAAAGHLCERIKVRVTLSGVMIFLARMRVTLTMPGGGYNEFKNAIN